jgi:Xaa-Pro aminopeptidase
MEQAVRSIDLTPPTEIHSRIHELQKKMAEKGLDLALIIQNVDLFYFSGTIQKGYLLIPAAGEAILFVQKDHKRAVGETPLRCVKIESFRDLPGYLEEDRLQGKKVGMELDVVPVILFNRVRGLFKHWEVADVSSEIKEIRAVKSDFEIEQIKMSGRIIDEVFSRAGHHIREGMTELDVDGILTSIGRSHGHQGFLRMRGLNQEMMNIHVLAGGSGASISFCDTPLSGIGLTPAVAQGSSARIIRRNEPIVIDYGGGYNGYVTDETRTFVIGRLNPSLQKAYEVALEIHEGARSSVKPGVSPVQIYEQAVERAGRAGLADHFMGYGEGKVAFAGHGLGLEINEWPVIGRGYRKPLQAGNVFAFEPKFVFPGEGAVGVELDYIVRENGLERVTHFPKEVGILQPAPSHQELREKMPRLRKGSERVIRQDRDGRLNQRKG